ncbi:hypothetical protein G7Y89_g11010 [Cudoniella acicularis]|uniref:Uncharacterized protein n=1 Tax=Cudoniella acicularis TaxID=354080 RepID=A0A8H4RFA4_9HELO|nr:hypothetical protein G7Y89_g11010 [Cudoniella acicularis]
MQHLVIHSFLTLAAVFPAHAFTNGSLIPSYFCNPQPDGLPKALGELIPQTVEQANVLAFNPNAGSNLLTVPVVNSTTKPGNAGYILASFHNTLNAITPIMPGLGLTLASGATTLQAGKANLLILDSLADNIALDGALLHARDVSGTPVGTFSDTGGIFVDFPGCGTNAEGKFNGVVHSQVITCNRTYTLLSYNAPADVVGPVTLGGLSVTDNGFGVWNYTFNVVGATTTDTTTVITVTTEESEADDKYIDELLAIVI